MRIAAVCLQAGRGKEENLRAIAEYVDAAAAASVQLVVFPECAVQGYPLGLGVPDLDEYQRQRDEAETVPGPATEFLATLSKKASLQIVVGLVEEPTDPSESGQLFNTAVLVRPDGVAAKYRKIHTGGVEKALWTRGRDFTVVDTVAGPTGMLICYDMVFPEAARSLALAGAQLLVCPTASPVDASHERTLETAYDLFSRSRALENQVFLVLANLVGGPSPGFYGHSRIVDPRGQVIAESDGPGMAVAEIAVAEEVREARARGWLGQVFLSDREPSAYYRVTRS